MLVIFDPPKNARNVALRGIPFRLALRLDWSTALVAEDTREDYGEQRFQSVGFIGDRLHVLFVHTETTGTACDQPAKG